MSTRALICAAALAVAMLVPAAARAAGETIVVEDPTSYPDGAPSTQFVAGWQLLAITCAKLVNYPDVPGAAGFALQPEVAAGLPAVSSDGLTYTFTIRPGYGFSPPSTEQVTAASFARAIERARNPAVGGIWTPFLDDLVSVVAAGDQLTVTLAAPAPDFLSRLSIPIFCAVPSDAPMDSPGPATMATAGPYSITSASPGEWVLEQNPNYGGSRIRNLGKIVWHYGVPIDTALADVASGVADYAPNIVNADVATLAAQYGPGSPAAAAGHRQWFENAAAVTWYLALNTSRPALADPRLRQAVNLAVDRTAIAGLRPLRTPTDQLLPPAFPGYADWSLYPSTPDLAQAEALAAAAGVTPATPVSAVLYTFSSSWGPAAGDLVRQALEPLGIEVTVEQFSRGEQIARTSTLGEPFDISITGWGADFADPYDFYNVLLGGSTIRPTNNNNISYFDDPYWNQRLADAAAIPLGAARNSAYAQLEHDLLTQAAPVASLFNSAVGELYAAGIGCQVYQPIYGTNLNQLCVRSAAPAAPGDTVSTGTDATADAPLQTAVTTPVAGQVSIQQGVSVVDPPVHYQLLAQQLLIEAPAATAADPLRLAFTLDASLVGSIDPATIVPLRDGTPIADCTGAAGAADPDPCVASRTVLAGGDLQLVVLSSHASRWNFGLLRNHDPVCSAAAASPDTLWPPNGSFHRVEATGVTDADGDALTTTVTGVVQNEPAGKVADVRLVDGGVLLRAQRDGHGSGRVYTVSFRSADGFGGSCTGTVSVRVPHDQR